MTCRFAGPTSGTVACSQSLLDSPSGRLTVVCRLWNNVADVLHESLKDIPGLHDHLDLELSSNQIKLSCYPEVVGGAKPLTDRWHADIYNSTYRVLTVCAPRVNRV